MGVLLRKRVIAGILISILVLIPLGMNIAVGDNGIKVKELSLEEAVSLALKNNPDMEMAQLAVKRAETEYEGAKDVASEFSVENIQTYDHALIKWVNPKAKEVTLAKSQKQKEVAEKSLKLSVESAYYNVLKAEKNLEIKREGLNYLKEQLKIAQTAYKVGTKAKVDVTSIEALEAASQAQVVYEENNYRTVVMELNRLIGLDLNTPLKLTAKFDIVKVGDSIKLEEVIKKALEGNVDILTVKKNQELAQVQYDIARKYYGGGVTVYETAKIDSKIADATVRKQETATEAAVKQSYLKLFTLEKMVDWHTKEVEKAEEIARVTTLRYKSGLATSLDVKSATIDLEEARLSLSEQIYNYNTVKSMFKYELFSSAAQ